jgi:large subunit ribosomal protein L15
MIRQKRKITKQRGTRTNGGGVVKNRRGYGNKGGRGKAGSGKQHWTRTVIENKNYFGKHGFKRPQKMIKKVNPVNISYLEDQCDVLIEKGLASEEGDSIVIDVTDLGYNKVLAKGNISKKLVIKSPKFSESAKFKIEEAGGEAVEL